MSSWMSNMFIYDKFFLFFRPIAVAKIIRINAKDLRMATRLPHEKRELALFLYKRVQ